MIVSVRGSALLFPLLIVSWLQPLFAQDIEKVSRDVWRKVQKEATVRVIVSLNVPGLWGKKVINKEDELARQKEIAAVQDQVFAELAGTNRTITREITTYPGLALEVDADALTKLERSPHVFKVSEDASIPMFPERVEVIGPVKKKQPSK
ncbi:MAG TPA: hypothetical protein VIE89_20985 [Candidatus Binatia bacterium]|jgi:hypothetical protein